MIVNNTDVLLGTGVVLLLLVFAGIVVLLALHDWTQEGAQMKELIGTTGFGR